MTLIAYRVDRHRSPPYASAMRRLITITACSTLAILAACNAEDDTFILIRSSALDSSMRIHVASFDTKDGPAYNQENCQIAADLFRQQPGVTVRY